MDCVKKYKKVSYTNPYRTLPCMILFIMVYSVLMFHILKSTIYKKLSFLKLQNKPLWRGSQTFYHSEKHVIFILVAFSGYNVTKVKLWKIKEQKPSIYGAWRNEGENKKIW